MSNTQKTNAELDNSLFAAKLRCEYLRNPIGIDVRQPRLSWVTQSDEEGQAQTAYRIRTASSEDSLESPDIWDSGKVAVNVSNQINYVGPPLQSGQRVYWQVQLWDQNGHSEQLSKIAWWEMGLLDAADWKAVWIAGPEPCPLFRKSFAVSLQVARARLYICGQGVYEVYINGKPVSDQVMGPQLSNFPVRMLYDTFDVTAILQQQQNVIGVRLAPGWFGGERMREEVIKKPDGPGHALIAQLRIVYTDGSEDIIPTDTSWKTVLSGMEPVKSHWIHCYKGSGERFNSVNEPSGWNTLQFDDESWENACAIKPPTKQLCASMIEPNRVVEVVKPVAVTKTMEPLDCAGFIDMAKSAGSRNWSLETMENPTFAKHWIPEFERSFKERKGASVAGFEADFGKHISGWVRIDVAGEKGDTVTMFGLDQHCLSGESKEEAGQRFMHRVFRYVPIHLSGKKQKPKIENIRALALQNDVRQVGRFECSNPVLNRIHDAAARTWAVHMLSGMPMDSWRERFGTCLLENCESAFYWSDMGAFYTKWMRDLRDSQRPDGYFSMSGGPIAYDYWSPNSAKNGIVFVPWLMYLHYGDRQVVADNYPAMKRWLELCIPDDDTGRTWQPPEDHGHAEAGYGDHGRPTERWYDQHTGDLFETLHTIHCFRMAENMANLLGKIKDAQYYAAVRERFTDKVNRDEFLDREHALYGGGDQGCHALALDQDVAPSGLRDRAAQYLIHDIMVKRGGHLNTGFLGTWYLLKALIMLNRPEVAVKIITNETPPSFACLLQHPDSPEELTLLPEFHGSGMIPHPGWCSVGSWFYQSLGGIKPDWEYPGFKRIIIKPQITKELDWVKAEYDSIAGAIGVNWTQQDRKIELTASIPTNSRARIHVPAETSDSVESPADSEFIEMEDGCAVFAVNSGTHTFRVGDYDEC